MANAKRQQRRQQKQQERLVYLPTTASGRARVSMYGQALPGWMQRPADWGGMEETGPATGQASWTNVNAPSAIRRPNRGFGRVAGGVLGGVAGAGHAVEMGARRGVRAGAGAAGRAAKQVAAPLPSAGRSAWRTATAPRPDPTVTSPAQAPVIRGALGPTGSTGWEMPMAGRPVGTYAYQGEHAVVDPNRLAIEARASAHPDDLIPRRMPATTPDTTVTTSGSRYGTGGGPSLARKTAAREKAGAPPKGKPGRGLGDVGRARFHSMLSDPNPVPRSVVPEKRSSGLYEDAGDIELPPGFIWSG